MWVLLLVAAVSIRLSFMHEKKATQLDEKIDQVAENLSDRIGRL
jgi:hypothetical protein